MVGLPVWAQVGVGGGREGVCVKSYCEGGSGGKHTVSMTWLVSMARGAGGVGVCMWELG
jgi:hypothetical protein